LALYPTPFTQSFPPLTPLAPSPLAQSSPPCRPRYSHAAASTRRALAQPAALNQIATLAQFAALAAVEVKIEEDESVKSKNSPKKKTQHNAKDKKEKTAKIEDGITDESQGTKKIKAQASLPNPPPDKSSDNKGPNKGTDEGNDGQLRVTSSSQPAHNLKKETSCSAADEDNKPTNNSRTSTDIKKQSDREPSEKAGREAEDEKDDRREEANPRYVNSPQRDVHNNRPVRQDKVKADDLSPVSRRHQASRPRDSSHDDRQPPAVRHARSVHADDSRRRARHRSAPLATSRHLPPPRDGSQTTCRKPRRAKPESRSSSREEVSCSRQCRSPAGDAADDKELTKEVKATRRQVNRKKDKQQKAKRSADFPETKKKSRRRPRQNTESEDLPDEEYEYSDIDESEERRKVKSENVAPKAVHRTKNPKSSSKIRRIQKKCGIYLQASQPKCPLFHEMHVSRILRLDQFVQPICNDCEVPFHPNAMCSFCWRCEPLHLVCVQCSFAGSTEQVIF
jgi:hypothetical protein